MRGRALRGSGGHGFRARLVPRPQPRDRLPRIAQEAFVIICEAMRKKGVVGVARVVLQRRERILMLEPLGKGLLAITLGYGYQVRSESAAFEDIADVQVQQNSLDLAARIIEPKTRRFDVSR